MALIDDVKKALKDAGEQLKDDLWEKEDAAFLAARAKDLVGLDAKALAAPNAKKKAEYASAARSVINHVTMRAMVRMQIAAKHILVAMERFFNNVVIPALSALLKSLF